METMDELMLNFLQDIYYAEKRGLRAMQKIARAASAQPLKDALLHHREQTEQQITRLEEVFDLLTGKRARAKRCEAIEGLAAETDEIIEESKKGPVLDAALIACVQAVEHYEIARYGSMLAWARQAGKDQAAELLKQTLDEEKQTDQLLSELAEGQSNPAAEQAEAAPEEAAPPKRARAGRKAKEPEPEPEPEPAAPKARRSRTASKPAATPRRSSRK